MVTKPRQSAAKLIPIVAICTTLSITTPNIYSQNQYDPNRLTVVVDPADKQNVTGQTELAFAWGQQFSPPQELQHGVINLKDAMNRWTKVQTSMNNHLMLSDQRIMQMPFVFVTADKVFELTETEKKNLKEYFDKGGFMFLDNAQPVSELSASGASLKKLIKDSIPNARFEALSNSHAIYHSFFDFNDGPPLSGEVGTIPSSNPLLRSPERFYLEGVYYKGRLAAVYSDKGYIIRWTQDIDNEPQLRMGVNLIVFALTQEGSIARQSSR
jgi:hypothetical protein